MNPANGNCANCDAALEGPYCHECGQKRAERLRFGPLVAEAFRRFTDVDRGFLHTLRGLTVAPGATIRSYIDGRRVRFAAPLRYYIVALAAWGVLPWLLKLDLKGPSTEMLHGLGMPKPATPEGVAQQKAQLDIVFDALRFFVAMQVPALAISAMLLYRRAQQTFAEHLAAALHILGHGLLLLAPGFIFDKLGIAWVSLGFLALQLVYTPYALFRLHGGLVRAIVASLLAHIVSYVLSAIVFIAAILILF